MDSLTQAALGAIVGQATIGRRIGNRALLWGAAFGTLPDLDVLLSPFIDTAGSLIHHRGASHSLLVMVAASLLLAPVLASRWQNSGATRREAGWFVFLVWSTHVLIDCFTVYGTTVFWPFSDYRVGFNNLFIIDLFFTTPLLVAIIWTALLRNAAASELRSTIANRSLAVSSVYVLLSLVAKLVASNAFAADLERRGIEYDRRTEAPTPLNIILWRSVVDLGDELWVGYRSIFEPRTVPVRWTIYPRQRAVMGSHADDREVRNVDHFSDGWWIARQLGGRTWIGDLRFTESRLWNTADGTVTSYIAFSWIYDPASPGDRLDQIEADEFQVGELFRRLIRRIGGDHAAWEGTPTLAGVAASDPETLRVVE